MKKILRLVNLPFSCLSITLDDPVMHLVTIFFKERIKLDQRHNP